MLFIIDGGVYSIAAPLTGRLLDRGLDCLPVLGLGSFVISLGFLMLAALPPLTVNPSLELVAVGAAVHGLGMALNFIATISLMTQLAGHGGTSTRASEQIHGLATGIWISCESLGGVLGSTAGGATYDWYSSHCNEALTSIVISLPQAGMEEQLSDRLQSAGRLGPAGVGRLHREDGHHLHQHQQDDGEEQTAG